LDGLRLTKIKLETIGGEVHKYSSIERRKNKNRGSFLRLRMLTLLTFQIEIRGFTLEPQSLIVIDQVFVTVGDNNASQYLLYSLMPDNWCLASLRGGDDKKKKKKNTSVKSDTMKDYYSKMTKKRLKST
jgi:hypothetical protein